MEVLLEARAAGLRVVEVRDAGAAVGHGLHRGAARAADDDERPRTAHGSTIAVASSRAEALLPSRVGNQNRGESV